MWRSLVPVDELFDVVIDSSEVGMRKPNPAIYHHALEAARRHPARARRCSSTTAPATSTGAQRAGLHAILVETPEQAIKDLTALLG